MIIMIEFNKQKVKILKQRRVMRKIKENKKKLDQMRD